MCWKHFRIFVFTNIRIRPNYKFVKSTFHNNVSLSTELWCYTYRGVDVGVKLVFVCTLKGTKRQYIVVK